MTAQITAIAITRPPRTSMAAIADHVEQDPGGEVLAKIIRGCGIEWKSFVVDLFSDDPRYWPASQRWERARAETRALGVRAATAAMAQAGLDQSEVGLFGATSTTTTGLPGLDGIAADLKLPSNTHKRALGPMGCYAAVPAVAAVADWVQVHQRPAVLVCADVSSPHLQPPPYDKESAVVFTLFGDGAAAVVLEPATTSRAGLEVVDTAVVTIPEHAGDIRVYPTDNGLRMYVSPAVPDIVASAVDGPVAELLDRYQLAHVDIDWWAVHPGGRRVVDNVAAKLTLPEASVQASHAVLREHGNTISSAVLMVLDRLRTTAPLQSGRHGMVLAFGPGTTVYAMLLRAKGNES